MVDAVYLFGMLSREVKNSFSNVSIPKCFFDTSPAIVAYVAQRFSS